MVSLGTKSDVLQVALMNAKRGLMNPLTPIGTSKLEVEQAFPLAPLQASSKNSPLRIGDAIDLTNKISPDGSLNWKVPEGKWKIIRVGTAFVEIPAGGGLLPDYLSVESTDFDFDHSSGVLIREAENKREQLLNIYMRIMLKFMAFIHGQRICWKNSVIDGGMTQNLTLQLWPVK